MQWQVFFILGAVASSAPVFAKLDFPAYMDVVTASLGTTGKDCVRNVANATDKLQSLLSSEQGAKQLTDLFRLVMPSCIMFCHLTVSNNIIFEQNIFIAKFVAT